MRRQRQDDGIVHIPPPMQRGSQRMQPQQRVTSQMGMGGGAAATVTDGSQSNNASSDSYYHLVHMALSPIPSSVFTAQDAQMFGEEILVTVGDKSKSKTVPLASLQNGEAIASILHRTPLFSQTMELQPVTFQLRTTDGTLLDPNEGVRDYVNWYVMRWRAAVKMARNMRLRKNDDVDVNEEVRQNLLFDIMHRSGHKDLLPKKQKKENDGGFNIFAQEQGKKTRSTIEVINEAILSISDAENSDKESAAPVPNDVKAFFDKLATGEINYVEWFNNNERGTDDIMGSGMLSQTPPVPDFISDDEYALVDPSYLRVVPHGPEITSGQPVPRSDGNGYMYDMNGAKTFDWVYTGKRPSLSRTFVFTFNRIGNDKLAGLPFASAIAPMMPMYNEKLGVAEARMFSIGNSIRMRMVVAHKIPPRSQSNTESSIYAHNNLNRGAPQGGRNRRRLPSRAILHISEQDGNDEASYQKSFQEVMADVKDAFRDQKGKSPGPITMRNIVRDDGTLHNVVIPGSGEIPTELLQPGENLETVIKPVIPPFEKDRDNEWINLVASTLRIHPSLIRMDSSNESASSSRVGSAASIITRTIMVDFYLRIRKLQRIAGELYKNIRDLSVRIRLQYMQMILERRASARSDIGARHIASLLSDSIRLSERADKIVAVQKSLRAAGSHKEVRDVLMGEHRAFLMGNIDSMRGHTLANALVGVSAHRQRTQDDQGSGIDIMDTELFFDPRSFVDHAAMMDVLERTGEFWEEGWRVVALNAGMPLEAIPSMIKAMKKNAQIERELTARPNGILQKRK